MEYLKARREDLEQVYQLVQDTIQTIYPQYYPHEIVGFFRNLHSKENIAADIDSGPDCRKAACQGNVLAGRKTQKIHMGGKQEERERR